MSGFFFIPVFIIAFAAVWFFAPLLHRPKAQLPVLFINKVGLPPACTKDKRNWISPTKLEKLFQTLQKKNMLSLLPGQVIKGNIPPNGIMLVFNGGYQSFYQIVFPLLQKYRLQASVILPAGLIGQYDAWQAPEIGPWQNLLTLEQIKELAKSGLTEIISTTLQGTPLSAESDETAIWQLLENKHRLQTLCHIKTDTVFCPQRPRPGVIQAIKKHFMLTVGASFGNNALPLDLSRPLKICPVFSFTFLSRLFWKIR